MRLKKIIPAFLILVLVLQLLPVRQVVRYFWIDNMATEETMHIDNSSTKNFNELDENHKFLPTFNYLLPKFAIVTDILTLPLNEALPLFHTADIQTPPPNWVHLKLSHRI
jgi:hypothetical protein